LWNTQDGISDIPISNYKYLNDLLSKDDFHAFVALKDKLLIGGLTAYELPMFKEDVREMFLYEIGVDENYRQKGIAKELIDSLKRTCLDKGIKIIFVGTSLDNPAARQLYKSTSGEEEVTAWFTYNLDDEITAGKNTSR
jgi:aminoglycoside 3-N-acetyltransferase I